MSTKTFTDEPLEQSPTFQKLSELSRITPFNTSDPVAVRGALSSALLFLIDALDNQTIQFNDPVGRAALWQIMLVNFEFITQMRPESPVMH